MDRHIVELLVPICFFAAVVLVIYFVSKYNHQTKKVIVENGGKISDDKRRLPVLELGLTIIGVGIGLVLSTFPMGSEMPQEIKDMLIGALVLLGGGGGLITAFFIRRKLEQRDSK